MHVYGFLADFAAYRPTLCENDQRMYRDLCRAAMDCLGDERQAEDMLVGVGVDEILFRECREKVGARIVTLLRKRGLTVRLAVDPLRLVIEPKERITKAIWAHVENWKTAIRDALLCEVPRE